MANWRKQQGESHHQVGHWRPDSFDRKPPLDNWHPTVPSWEKKFCALVGSVPWRKLIETKKYMYLHDNVVKWDDSAGREAFHNAKKRFWAALNGLPCNIPLPDPNLYIDDVDWSSTVDPELILDLEREAKVPSEDERDEEVVILGSSLLNQSFSCTGWGDAEADILKPTGWESDLHENNGVDSWEQYCVPVDPAKEYDWTNCPNDSWGWNERKHYGGDSHKMGKGRAGGNWGAWDGYNRKRENLIWRSKTPANHAENMSWQKTPASHAENMSWQETPADLGDQYQMNRGRRNNNRGRKKGNSSHDHPYVDKIPTAL